MAHITNVALLQWLGIVLAGAASAVVLTASWRSLVRERAHRRARTRTGKENSS